MVYGAIDQESAKWYTDLGKVFGGIGDTICKYNWLITDSEVYSQDSKFEKFNTKPYYIKKEDAFVRIPCREYVFLPGEELQEIIHAEHAQWIWGVLSGIEKNVPLDQILSHPLPYADGYKGFWEKPLTIQHPLAEVEIVPWDSSLVLVLSKHKEIVDQFKAAFPKSEDLTDYLRRCGNREDYED